MKKQGVLIYDDVMGRMDLHHNSAFTQNLGLAPVLICKAGTPHKGLWITVNLHA